MVNTYRKVKRVTKKTQQANERISKINLREYNKELRRLQRAVKRIEERGYTFGKLPFKELTRPLPASIERLQAIKTKDLYKYAKYETEAGTISGTERRKQERQESARKTRETRLRNQAKRSQEESDKVSRETPERQETNYEPTSQQIEYEQQQFEEEMRRRDEETKRRLNEEQEYRERFSQGKIIYEQIMDMIYDIDITHHASAESLRKHLNDEFDQYGEDAVLMAMANAPSEFIESAQRALTYKPEDERHVMAITNIHKLISGTVPTMEEAQRIQDSIERDSYYDGI